MKVWRLFRSPSCPAEWGEVEEFVVVAASPSDARVVAAAVAGTEGRGVWLSVRESLVEERGPSRVTESQVLVRTRCTRFGV